jgi:hypothetical protein
MSHKTYQLVNPVIQGTFNDIVDSVKTPISAAETVWNRLTTHVSGHVPKFMFSLKDIENNTLNHFEAKEKISDGSYTIKEMKGLNVNIQDIDNFHAQIDRVKKNQNGGKRKRYKKYNKNGSLYPRINSSSDSDSDSVSDTESISESDSDVESDVYSGIEFTSNTTSPIIMLDYTTKFYYQDDGRVFEYKSTKNPQPIVVDPIPVVQLPISIPITTTRSRYAFSSIPVFKPPLLPCINIWN